MRYQPASFLPLSGRRAFLQEDSSCLVYSEAHNCSVTPKSSDYPKRNLISILLMRIDPTPGQHTVSSLETLLKTLLRLTKRKVCEKSCRLHLTRIVV